jgi:hypothetical protein
LLQLAKSADSGLCTLGETQKSADCVQDCVAAAKGCVWF